jgi:hypothetical protein
VDLPARPGVVSCPRGYGAADRPTRVWGQAVKTRSHTERSTAHLPNFFIVGANKAGTTSLHHYLGQHPDILMSANKEPTFLSLLHLGGLPQQPPPPFGSALVYEWADYLRLFESEEPALAVGEASTAYLTSHYAPWTIHEHFPHARIVAVLRHPVDRAYSQFLMYRRAGIEGFDAFEDALQDELKKRAAGLPLDNHYTELSRYGAGLARYYSLFPADRIRVYRYEQLRDDGGSLLRDLFSFLEVDAGAAVDTSARLNASPGTGSNGHGTQLPDAIRRRLATFFREDLMEVDRLTGGNFARWLEE